MRVLSLNESLGFVMLERHTSSGALNDPIYPLIDLTVGSWPGTQTLIRSRPEFRIDYARLRLQES
jgi:hypothetical protein